MTPRGRLPPEWGSSPPDRLAGYMFAFMKMVGFGFLLWIVATGLLQWLGVR